MSAFDANLRSVERLHHRLVGDLQCAVTVLAVVPSYMIPDESLEDADDEARDLNDKQKEMIRLARLYADPALIKGVAYESVIERLSEGLIE